MADVAAASEVSIATASYVLAGRTDVSVSAATRERVIANARSLGYRRNSVAAALRQGRSTAIAIVCPEAPTGASADLVLAIVEAATRRRMAPTVFIGPAPDGSAAEFDGLIILGKAEGRWKAEGVSIVEIGGDGQCQLYVDDYGGARNAVGHLLSLGHRRVVHFAGAQTEFSAQERLRGYFEGALEGRLSLDASRVVYDFAELELALTAVDQPTGLFLVDAALAPNAYRVARRIGLRIPDDLSIVAFGDDARSTWVDPALTVARVPVAELSITALELLVSLLAGGQVPERTMVSASLVIRESTARVALERGL